MLTQRQKQAVDALKDSLSQLRDMRSNPEPGTIDYHFERLARVQQRVSKRLHEFFPMEAKDFNDRRFGSRSIDDPLGNFDSKILELISYLENLISEVEKYPEDFFSPTSNIEPNEENSLGGGKKLDRNQARKMLYEIVDEIDSLEGLDHEHLSFRRWRDRATKILELLSKNGFISEEESQKLKVKAFCNTLPRYGNSGRDYNREAYDRDLRDTKNSLLSTIELFDYSTSDASSEGKVRERENVVFLGHGNHPVWKDIREELENDLGLDVEYFEKKTRTSEWNAQVVKGMVDICSHAVIVATAEDLIMKVNEGGKTISYSQPRPNVIHEMGMCHGRMGISNVFILLEGDRRYLSNTEGLQVIRLDPENHKSALFDLRKTLKDRELIQS